MVFNFRGGSILQWGMKWCAWQQLLLFCTILIIYFNTLNARDVLRCPKMRYHTGQEHVNTSYVYSIFSALQAAQEHLYWSIHYSHALCCHLYTILDLALNALKCTGSSASQICRNRTCSDCVWCCAFFRATSILKMTYKKTSTLHASYGSNTVQYSRLQSL